MSVAHGTPNPDSCIERARSWAVEGSYAIDWGRAVTALALSNFVTGIVLGLIYTFLYYIPFAGAPTPNAALTLIGSSAAFGLLIPTAIGILSLICNNHMLRAWPIWAAMGPILTSAGWGALLCFVVPCNFVLVSITVLFGGTLNFIAMKLVRAVTRTDSP